MKSRDGAGYFAVALIAAPVVAGGLYSIAASLGLVGAGADGLSTIRWSRILSSPTTWQSIGWTIATAAVGTLLAAAVAMFLSVQLKSSRVGQMIALLPMAVPHVAAALAALLLFAQSGMISRVAFALGFVTQPSDFPALVYDRAGIALIWSFAWKEFPFLMLSALAVLHTAGDTLHDVARTHGANAREVFRRVTWPLLWRGLAPSVIAVFAYLIGQYEMGALLAPSDTLPLAMLTYERAQDPDLARRGEAHVLGLLALALTLALVFVHERVRSPYAVRSSDT